MDFGKALGDVWSGTWRSSVNMIPGVNVGGGIKEGVSNIVEREAKNSAQKMMDDPEYRAEMMGKGMDGLKESGQDYLNKFTDGEIKIPGMENISSYLGGIGDNANIQGGGMNSFMDMAGSDSVGPAIGKVLEDTGLGDFAGIGAGLGGSAGQRGSEGHDGKSGLAGVISGFMDKLSGKDDDGKSGDRLVDRFTGPGEKKEMAGTGVDLDSASVEDAGGVRQAVNDEPDVGAGEQTAQMQMG